MNKTTPVYGKFKGNRVELSGYVFDCSDLRQVDKYVTNIKRIASRESPNAPELNISKVAIFVQ